MTRLPQYKEEIDFRDLVRHPRKLFGFSYLYFLKLLVALGILYAWNLNDIGKNTYVPLVVEDSSAFITDIPMQSASALPPVDVHSIASPTAQLLSRGGELYKANCSSCHGDNGLGDGPAGLTLTPRPRKLHEAAGWTNGAKVSAIYRTLEEGIIRNGMPSFGYLPPADRFALIHFVRSFHPAPPADSEEDITGLETTYQLSRGRTGQAQIPIREAMKRIAAEARPGRDSLMVRVELRRAGSRDPGALLYSQYIENPERFLAACRSSRAAIASSEQFIHMVSSDPPSVGVRPAIASLDVRDWSLLHQFVLSEVY